MEIVAEQQEAPAGFAQQAEQGRQRRKIVALDLDQQQLGRGRLVHGVVHGLDQRGLAHAPGAPEHGIIGWKPARKALGVLKHEILLTGDAVQQPEIDVRDRCHRRHPSPLRAPDIGRGIIERTKHRRRRRKPFQRLGDPGQQRGDLFGQGRHPETGGPA